MGETVTITGTEHFDGTYEVKNKTVKCHCCGHEMTEQEAIAAGLLHDPNETWEQFQGRTGQND